MKAVKKNEFAQKLADRLSIPKKQAAEFVEIFTEEVTKIMKNGDKLNLSGFGIFKVADRKAREGRNPRTGETIQIKASKKPRFTAGKLLKEAVGATK